MNPAQERLKEIEEIDILKINTGSHSMIDEEDYQELKFKLKEKTHELGHIFEHCELKRDYSSEQFADSFRVE